MNKGLYIYLIFVISWFIHIGARLPLLGVIRFDLLLICVLMYLAIQKSTERIKYKSETDRLLKSMILYSILTIPFVQWPGSVITHGIPEFIKAIVFYYFTIAFVNTRKDLAKFVLVFVVCQLFRILEPLYLHITEGYWGSLASMANWEYLERLSGAPYDIVNPNGLAFIVCTVLPFMYFLASMSWVHRAAFLVLTPTCLYVLVLTGSRTGVLALIVIFLAILFRAKRRLIVGIFGIVVVVTVFPLLSADMQDRYLSTFGGGEKNEATAEGRAEGVKASFLLAARRPIFGHGLGTSREVNANFGEVDQPAHNLYAEVAQELGLAGLVILVLFLKSIFSGFAKCRREYARQDAGLFLPKVVDAMEVWLIMNLLFSFASYGLSSYEWYLLGGLSVTMQRLAAETLPARVEDEV